MSTYNFRLRYNSQTRVVYPRGYQDCNKEQTILDNGSKRTTLSGELEFCGDDFDFILSKSFNTEHILEIDRDTEVNYYVGTFFIHEANINADEKTLTISLKTKDYYEEFSNILDKKVNLSNLSIAKQKIRHYTPSLVQVYVLGDDKLMNYQGGVAWEQDCQIIEYPIANTAFAGTEFDKFKITQMQAFTICRGSLQISQSWYASDINMWGVVDEYTSADSLYRMEHTHLVSPIRVTWKIYRNSDDVLLYVSNEIEDSGINPFLDLFTFTYQLSGGIAAIFERESRVVVRILTNNAYEWSGFNFFDNDNSFANNYSYEYLVGGSHDNMTSIDVQINTDVQISTTKFNLNPDGKYYKEKVSATNHKFYPVGAGYWGYYSIWFRGDDTLDQQLIIARSQVDIQGFKIDDVFNVIFSKYNIPITYVSQFFNNTSNPINNHERIYPIITQITNMYAKNGSILATKNEITLQELLTFLTERYNLAWAIIDNKFYLEHIYYFSNNLKYTSNTDYLDLTAKISYRIGKSWASKSNKYKYDIKNLYKNWTFTEENASDLLRSGLITTTSTSTNEKTTDSSGFYTDVQNILANHEQNEGYFFGCYKKFTNEYRLDFQQTTVKSTSIWIQNLYGTLPYCLKYYFGYNDFGTTVTIDGVSYAVKGFFRGKIQEIEYPLGSSFDPSIYKLVKTELGIAFCEKIVVNLNDRICNLTISHAI